MVPWHEGGQTLNKALSARLSRLRLPAWLGGASPAPAPNGSKSENETGVFFANPIDIRQAIGSGTGMQARDAERLTRATAFVTSAYCFIAMRWRASRVAEPPLMVVQETQDGEEWQPDHPLAELFDAPRPDLDMGELLHRKQLYQDLTGAALLVVDRDISGRSRILTPFSGDEFQTDPAGGLIYGRYSVIGASGGWKDLDLAATPVIHFRDPNPYSWREQFSLVDAAMLQLDLGHTVRRIVRNYLSNAIFPGGILSTHPDWKPTPAEWDLWKSAVKQWHGGPANAGEPLAVPGGTVFSKTASAMKDLLPDDVLDRVEATVASTFGISPVTLGWLTGLQNSPWSQMAESRRKDYEDTVQPIWRDIERRFSRTLLTPEERRAGFIVRFDTRQVVALQEDQEVRSRISLANRDTWTVDERRIYTGQDALDPSDPRGSMIVGIDVKAAAPPPGSAGQPVPAAPKVEVQALVFPKAHWATAAACAGWAMGRGFRAVKASETADAYHLRVRAPDAFDGATLRTVSLLGARRPGDERCRVSAVVGRPKSAKLIRLPFDRTPRVRAADIETIDERTLAWLDFDIQTKAAESTWEREVAGVLASIRRKVVALAGHLLQDDGKAVDPHSATEFTHALHGTLNDARHALQSTTYPLVLSTGKEAVGRIAARHNLSFGVLEPGLLKYAKEEAAFLSDVMGEATGTAVAEAVQAGLAAGETVRQLRQRLEELPAFSRERAQLVARTETTRAWNGAQRRSMSTFARDSNRGVTKSWLSARDDRVREEHDALDDGTEIGIDDAFANGLTEPGEPNCRCSLTYQVAPPVGAEED